MTGWYLIWVLTIRTGADFVMIPHELPQPSFDACARAKIELEQELTENPAEWGDFTSFNVDCKYKGQYKGRVGFDDPNDYSLPPITEEELKNSQ